MLGKIAFIGGGNMASSLIGGLLVNGHDADDIVVSDPSEEQCERVLNQFGVNTTSNNITAATNADIVVLAIKPQVMTSVCHQLASVDMSNKLIISIAAGIPIELLNNFFPDCPSVVRCMPNTPALVQQGITGLYATEKTTPSQRNKTEKILKAVGKVLWVDNEDELDAVTAVSGSGPAYFFMVMEAIEDAAKSIGLSETAAKLLTRQTALGAATMALAPGQDVVELRRRVTSKGGTTEQAVAALEANHLRETFQQAVEAACQRSKELAAELKNG